jgi:hypothetical protein
MLLRPVLPSPSLSRFTFEKLLGVFRFGFSKAKSRKGRRQNYSDGGSSSVREHKHIVKLGEFWPKDLKEYMP